MKVVIVTQCRENYGAHDWDGQGECPQYWKCKGGYTYVVPILSPNDCIRIKELGIPTLTKLIESRSDGFEEIIVDWFFADDADAVCDKWETPTFLSWENDRWVARCTTINGEYGYMRSEIDSKTEKYDMTMAGGRENYTVVYTMRNGDVVPSHMLENYFNKLQKSNTAG